MVLGSRFVVSVCIFLVKNIRRERVTGINLSVRVSGQKLHRLMMMLILIEKERFNLSLLIQGFRKTLVKRYKNRIILMLCGCSHPTSYYPSNGNRKSMFGCLLVNRLKTAEKIWIKFDMELVP